MTHALPPTEGAPLHAGEVRRGALDQRSADKLGEMLELFLNARDLAPLSRDVYKRAILRFIDWLSVARVHPALVGVEYRKHLEGRAMKPRTVATYIAAIRAFFSFLKSQNAVDVNPFELIRVKLPGDRYERPILQESEAALLLSSVGSDRPVDARDRALLYLLLHTGLRIQEAVSTDIADLAERSGTTVLNVKGKGHREKDDFVVVLPNVLRPLSDYLLITRRSLRHTGPLFLSHNRGANGGRLTKIGAQKAIARRLKRVGLKRLGLLAHSLRHTAATTALLHGATPFDVAKMLRHRSLNSTMIYLHATERLTAGAEHKIHFDPKTGK